MKSSPPRGDVRMTTYKVTDEQFQQLLTIARLYALAYPYSMGEQA